jgi:hypothetical protein
MIPISNVRAWDQTVAVDSSVKIDSISGQFSEMEVDMSSTLKIFSGS